MSAVKKSQPVAKDLVLGLGATGLSVARFLRRQGGDAVFADSREDPPGVQQLASLWPAADVRLGATRLPADIGRVIVSPGVAEDAPLLRAARSAGIDVVSDIELFVQAAPAPFAAITGSNGKSTVTTLLYHMGRAAGLNTLAGGNLGKPALDLLEAEAPDMYVLELSSFQLQRTQTLPAAVAVLLNVSPDHLDWHASEAEYRAAKYRIFHEARAAVFNRADADAAKHCRNIEPAISFGLDAPAAGHYGLQKEGGSEYLAHGETLLIACRDMQLVGVHNRLNALAALAAGELLGLQMPAMLQVLTEFPGLPHRMQFVARRRGVAYINDSKATNVAAAVASIESIDGMLVLLAGGEGKGGDFTALAQATENKLRALVLFGADAQAIAAAVDTVMPVYFATDMQDAVQQAAHYAEADDTVLLAPACASFDQYENFGARGEAFRAAVEALPR